MREYRLLDDSLLMTDGQHMWLKRLGREPEPVTADDILPELLELLESQRQTKVARLQLELAHALDESVKLGAEDEARTVLDAYRPILEDRSSAQ
jgi:hypothetical protein